jgi:hypothetical protein
MPASELANPAGNGARHHQMRSLILSLLEIGLSERAIFVQFRGMYGDDVPDSEIEEIIKGGVARVGRSAAARHDRPARLLTAQEAIERATAWLGGFQIDEAELWDASQIRPADGEDPARDSIMMLEHLYRPHEFVCINTRYLVAPKKDGVEKVTIIGAGQTRTAAQWIEHIKASGTPQNRAGAWIRLNPVRSVQGSGSGNAHCDAGQRGIRRTH